MPYIVADQSDIYSLGFEFCVFVAGWRHALRSEWPFIIIILYIYVRINTAIDRIALYSAIQKS